MRISDWSSDVCSSDLRAWIRLPSARAEWNLRERNADPISLLISTIQQSRVQTQHWNELSFDTLSRERASLSPRRKKFPLPDQRSRKAPRLDFQIYSHSN